MELWMVFIASYLRGALATFSSSWSLSSEPFRAGLYKMSVENPESWIIPDWQPCSLVLMGQSLSQRLAKSAALRVISSKPFSSQLPQQNVRNIFLSIFVNNNFLKALAVHWAHMYWVLWGHLRLWAEGDYIFGWGTVDGGRMSWCLAVSVNPCFIGFKTATVLWTALRKKKL